MAASLIKLSDLHTGCRLLVRSRTDWRVAAISRKTSEKVTITVASPSGRNYRLWRSPQEMLTVDEELPVLNSKEKDLWTENFTSYDARW